METISSDQNKKFRIWLSLLSSKGIKKEGLCLVSGEKIVKEIKQKAPDLIVAKLASENAPETDSDFLLAKHLFDTLDVLGTHSAMLVAKTPSLKEWREENPVNGKEILLPCGDPSNLGACIRSASAFGMNEIVLLEEAASPFLPRSIKSSSGASLHYNLSKGPSIQALSYQIMALDANGDAIAKFNWPKAGRLLVGEEGPGLPNEFKTQKLSIPMSNKVESLNAGVAASVAMYSWITSMQDD